MEPPNNIPPYDDDSCWRVKIRLGSNTVAAYAAATARHDGDEVLFDRIIRYGRLLHEHFMLKHEVGFGTTPDEATHNQIYERYITKSDAEAPPAAKSASQPPLPVREFEGSMTSYSSVERLVDDTGVSMTKAIHVLLDLGTTADSELCQPGVRCFVRRSPGAAMVETPID